MPIEVHKNGGFSCTGNGVRLFQMRAQLSALHLEILGLKYSRGSVYAHIKRTYQLKGNKQRVYDQFKKIVEEFDEKVVRVYET